MEPILAAAKYNYRKALLKGLVKVLSKMGISTIQAYRGAQIFESVGISRELVEHHFTGTAARLSGVGLNEIADEVAARHLRGYAPRAAVNGALDVGGRVPMARRGRVSPQQSTDYPQAAAGLSRRRLPEVQGVQQPGRFPAGEAGDPARPAGVAAGLRSRAPEEVEPATAIVKRFKTGAMSYGSISKEAHETLAIAMNRIGGKSNTGEGGEDPARYVPDANGDSRNSAIKQVASARFGVTSQYLVNAQELQIKMAQGAKPGEGGQLPGTKVYPWIAEVRHSTPGVGLISPPAAP